MLRCSLFAAACLGAWLPASAQQDCGSTRSTGCSGNGRCANSKCFCNTGYFGPSCSLSQLQCNDEVCNKRGVCVRPKSDRAFECDCSQTCGWTGTVCSVCSTSSCPDVCPDVPLLSTTVLGREGSEDLPWWLPLAILLPIVFILGVSAVLVRQVLAMRKEGGRVRRFDDTADETTDRTAQGARQQPPAAANKYAIAFEAGAGKPADNAASSDGIERGDIEVAISGSPDSPRRKKGVKKKKHPGGHHGPRGRSALQRPRGL